MRVSKQGSADQSQKISDQLGGWNKTDTELISQHQMNHVMGVTWYKSDEISVGFIWLNVSIFVVEGYKDWSSFQISLKSDQIKG